MTRVLTLDRAHKLIAIMSNYWFQEFAGLFRFPDNYTTIDLETNGVLTPTRVSPRHSMICTFGWSVIRDRQLVSTQEVAINWEETGCIGREQFLQELVNTERAMRAQGKAFQHTSAYLREHGIDPIEALQQLLDVVESAEERKEVLVTQNGWKFDIELMQAHFHNFLAIKWMFQPNLVFDAGICEKASQLSDRDNPLPTPGETMKQFAWRIGPLRRRGVKWALDGHCQQKYQLFEKSGLTREQLHGAGADSILLHYLFEEHRKLAGVADQIHDPLSSVPQTVLQSE